MTRIIILVSATEKQKRENIRKSKENGIKPFKVLKISCIVFVDNFEFENPCLIPKLVFSLQDMTSTITKLILRFAK